MQKLVIHVNFDFSTIVETWIRVPYAQRENTSVSYEEKMRVWLAESRNGIFRIGNPIVHDPLYHEGVMIPDEPAHMSYN